MIAVYSTGTALVAVLDGVPASRERKDGVKRGRRDGVDVRL